MNTFQDEKGKLLCTLEERIDTLSAQNLEWELDMRIRDEHRELILDAAAVAFVSSSFLRLCIRFSKIIGKENFRVINVSPAIMKVFEIANLRELCQPA